MDSLEGINDCANELLQAQTHICNYHLSYIKSMSLKCAVQLEIPDAIHNLGGRPMTISDLALALSISPTKVRHLHHLMRFLVQAGFFAEQDIATQTNQEKKGYVLTASSRLLLKDCPMSQRPLVLSIVPYLTTPWDFTIHWFQTDDDQGIFTSPFAMAQGKPMWEFARDEPKFNDQFNESMASVSILSNSVVMSKCKAVFEGLTSIVDVGGGTGSMAKAIAKEFPDMECVVFDLPHVVSDLKSDKNLKFIGGDMFHGIPSADAVILKSVLHDWNDEDCIKILKRCKEGVSKKLVVIDMVLGDKEKSIEVETQLLLDMQMMVLLAGKERNEEEWAKLFNEAGFGSYNISHILGLSSLIEVYP